MRPSVVARSYTPVTLPRAEHPYVAEGEPTGPPPLLMAHGCLLSRAPCADNPPGSETVARPIAMERTAPLLLVNGLRQRRFQTIRAWAAAASPGLQMKDLGGGRSINARNPRAFAAAADGFMAMNN